MQDVGARLDDLHKKRVQLLRSGYQPLPNRDKRLFVEGWPDVEITEEWLEQYRGLFKHQAIGLRMHDCLMAIDVDVEDGGIVEELWQRLAAAGVPLGGALVRHSGKDKEMWILRSEEPFKFASSAKYVAPGVDPEGEDLVTAQVEVFGGDARKQIGVYGAHTLDDGAVEPSRFYEYDGPSILDVPYDKLPVCPQALVGQISIIFGDLMSEQGWQRVRRFGALTDGNSIAYDLPSGPFVTPAGETPYDSLHLHPSCRMREILGRGSNTDRGRVYDFDGWTGVWDSETHVVHLPEEAKPEDLQDKVTKLSERLRQIDGGEEAMAAAAERVENERRAMTVEDIDGWDPEEWRLRWDEDFDAEAALEDWLEENDQRLEADEIGKRRTLLNAMIGRSQLQAMVEHLSVRYAYYGLSDAKEEVYDVLAATAIPLSVLRNTYASYSARVPAVTPAGNPTTKVVNAVDVWLGAEARVTLSGFDFKPGDTALFQPGIAPKTVKLNSYRPRRFSATAMSPASAGELMEGFLAHLVPDEMERAFLRNHIVGLRQHPEMRGQAVLMISDRGGVGRNTLFQIIDSLFDPRFTHALRSMDLVGERARFNAWEENCLFAHVDELATILSATGTNKFAAMAMLDDRVDPVPQRKTIEDKGRRPRTEWVYWTLIAATMEPDAIALEPRDRRWTVLRNTNSRIIDSAATQAAVTRMQGGIAKGPIDEGFMHGLALWLDEQPFDRELFMEGIWTEAKDEVVAAAEGDIETTMRTVLNRHAHQGEIEVWRDNIVWEVQQELGKDHNARNKAVTTVRKLLAQGFNNWVCDREYRPRVASDPSVPDEPRVHNLRPKGLVARLQNSAELDPRERALMLGERKILRRG